MSEWSKHRMNKSERQGYVLRRARELALSGEHADWLSVETELRFNEDFAEAREWLDSRFTRDELDRLCKYAQQSKKPTPAA